MRQHLAQADRDTPPIPGQAHDRYRAVRYFANLDGLRFMCIAMVLWHHAQPMPKGTAQLLDRGFLGVDFFFVLSGFLITTLLLREAARNGRISLPGFYLRRILRIVPIYFFVVTLVALLYIVVKGETQYLRLLPYYYLFLSNFLTEHIPTLSITWSLSVEEQYYLLWPIALMLLPRRMLVIVALILIAVNVAVSGGYVAAGTPARAGPLLFTLPTATYAPILMGSLLAITLHGGRGFAMIHRLLGHRLAAPACFIALIAAMQWTPQDVHGWPNLIIHLAMTATLAALVVREDTVFTPLLTRPLIARIGQISYGVYLYHLIALDPVSRVLTMAGMTNGWLFLIAYSAASVIVADISFRTLEAFFRRFRPGS